MYGKMKEFLQKELADIREAGLYKEERIIASPQRAEIEVGGKKVLNFCANNYLGLSDNPRLVEAAKKEMDARGYGMSSVRFICGTQDIHKEPLRSISVRRTPSSTPHASMRTEAYSNRSSRTRTPSSPTRSTTHPSSTA